MSKTTNKKKNHDFRKWVKAFWLLILAGVGALILSVLLAAAGAFGALPGFDEIENPRSNLASQIISSDGVLIGKFFTENRTHVDYHELSPHLVNALIATEDERYYSHNGIDYKALMRSAATLGKAGGGSTITQQLAKMMFHDPPGNIFGRVLQKIQEWVIAARLERQYTKEEIIAMYFNQFDFLYQAVGIQSASSIYFNTSPDKLKIHEAALLVGMAKNPAYFNPVRFKERALSRRNTVFNQMYKNDYISKEERDSLKLVPLGLTFSRQGHDQGMAPYFREHLRSFMKDWIEAHPKSDGEKYNLYTDGLRIHVTIDSRLQKAAEEAVTRHLTNLQELFFKKEKGRKTAPFHNINQEEINSILDQAVRRSDRYRRMKEAGISSDSIKKVFNTPVPMTVFHWTGDRDTVMTPMDSIRYYKFFYQAGMMSVEPETGFIKAWVGGINFRHFKYDHVYTSRRQVGSTFKPFVYATAIKQKHYSPCFEVPNVRTCIEKGMFGLLEDWCPENSYPPEYGGVLTLKEALAKSKNTVTTYLMKQIGPEAVIRLAQDMGIESEIPVQPSIALGTVDLSVYELVGSYTTFLNKGVYTQPIYITRIEDRNGVVLQEFTPRTREVMSEEDAYVILNLLKGVTESGTGGRLRYTSGNYPSGEVTGFPYGFTNPIAGKTGTTQNNSDGWFMGAVPNLITGVWTGCEDRAAHFGSTALGQGATTALPIWALYMKEIYKIKDLGISTGDFEAPAGPLSIELNCAKYRQQQQSAMDDNDEFDF